MPTYIKEIERFAMSSGLLLLVACSRTEAPKTYEDCILTYMQGAKTPPALAMVKQACKDKFPVTFDFDQLARSASVPTWSAIAVKPDFTKLSREEKTETRSAYYDEVLRPKIHPDFVEEGRAQFQAHWRKTEKAASDAAASAPASTSSAVLK